MAIAGGVTGGHLFPGLALAEELKKRDPGMEVLFIGTEHGIESRVIPREGYPIRYIKSRGVLGKSPLKKALALWLGLTSVFSCRSMFNASRPDVVVGTGGYASVSPVLAARLMSIPTLVMEQNIVPGLANRLLGRLVDSVAVTYHESMGYFPKEKSLLTGNPVREGILKGDRKRALELFSLDAERLTVLVFGGSAGARRLNECMLGALNHLLDMRDEVQFLHQTGEQDYERVRKLYRDLGFRAMAAPFIYQMAEAYAVADVVVCRAGATTLAELTALGKASVLVPYPHAAGHQEFNARKLVEMGGAWMLRDRELSADSLAGLLRDLLRSESMRAEMRRQSSALGRPDAAQKVADLALSLAKAGNDEPWGKTNV